MKPLNITFSYLVLITILSLMVFVAGLFETTRIESFNIVEGNILNESSLNNTAVWTDYEEFKTTYIFTNTPAINFINFAGGLGLLYLIWYSWSMGRNSKPLELSEIFTSQILLLLLTVYLGSVIFDYIINIFLDQLIIVLFNEIYTSVYMYNLIIDWFIGFILFSYVLAWLSNQLKYFNLLSQ